MLLSSGVLLPTLNLRPYFHTIAKGESHLAVRIDRCVIHKPVEQLPYPLLVQMGARRYLLSPCYLKSGLQGGISTKPAEWFKRQVSDFIISSNSLSE